MQPLARPLGGIFSSLWQDSAPRVHTPHLPGVLPALKGVLESTLQHRDDKLPAEAAWPAWVCSSWRGRLSCLSPAMLQPSAPAGRSGASRGAARHCGAQRPWGAAGSGGSGEAAEGGEAPRRFTRPRGAEGSAARGCLRGGGAVRKAGPCTVRGGAVRSGGPWGDGGKRGRGRGFGSWVWSKRSLRAFVGCVTSGLKLLTASFLSQNTI